MVGVLEDDETVQRIVVLDIEPPPTGGRKTRVQGQSDPHGRPSDADAGPNPDGEGPGAEAARLVEEPLGSGWSRRTPGSGLV